MELGTFVKHFVRVELACCAVGCILYLTDDADREKQFQRLLSKGNHLTVLKQATEWMQEGRTVPMLKQVSNEKTCVCVALMKQVGEERRVR